MVMNTTPVMNDSNQFLNSTATNCQVSSVPSKRSRSQSRPECDSMPPSKRIAVSSTKSCLSKANRKPNSKSKKRVRFHDDSKKWDGPRQEHVLLERLVIDFWGTAQKLTVLEELVDNDNDTMLLTLKSLVMAAIERVEQSANNRGAPLIPSGAKRGVRLHLRNLPRVKLLLAHVEDSYNSVWLLKMLATP